MFVLSGGVTRAGQLLLVPVVAAYRENLTARDRRPLARIELAELGQDAGLVGVADLAANEARASGLRSGGARGFRP
jgi:glucokinase